MRSEATLDGVHPKGVGLPFVSGIGRASMNLKGHRLLSRGLELELLEPREVRADCLSCRVRPTSSPATSRA